jgi:hypothetical protein
MAGMSGPVFKENRLAAFHIGHEAAKENHRWSLPFGFMKGDPAAGLRVQKLRHVFPRIFAASCTSCMRLRSLKPWKLP